MSCSYYQFRNNDYYCNKKGDYVNSDAYSRYCKGYSYSDCPIYKNESSSGCYLTSACVEAKGLPDDCYELTTLRRFRDEWLSSQPYGAEDIAEYYRTAPTIVTAIRERPDYKQIFDLIFSNLVTICITFIEQNMPDQAYQHYKTFTHQLQKQYLSTLEG